MSYPPPPGLSASTRNPPANLPARPPPSAGNSNTFKSEHGATRPSFAAFAPRTLASAAPGRTNSPAQYSALPNPSYSAAPSYSQPAQDPYGAQSYDQYQQSTAPQIRNPFVPTAGSSAGTGYGAPPNYDPEYEAQIQQWQSAYMSRDEKPNAVRTAPPSDPTTASTTPNAQKPEQQKTVKREGGGTTWTDSSLLEWDPAHFRLFIGNLAGEVTDESLHKAFSRYESVQKARVIREKRTTKSKGYGFVSFSDGDDYFLAAKEMNGKYIGSHPVTITKAKTEVRATTIKNDRNKKHKGAGGHGKVEFGGVKKNPKTKGGLKVLG